MIDVQAVSRACRWGEKVSGAIRASAGKAAHQLAINEPDPFFEALNDEDLAAIRAYLQQQRAYGRDDFRVMEEAKTQRFAGVRPAHRPAKSGETAG